MTTNEEELLVNAKEYFESFIRVFSESTAEAEDRSDLQEQKDELGRRIERQHQINSLFQRNYRELQAYYTSLPEKIKLRGHYGEAMKITMEFFDRQVQSKNKEGGLFKQAIYVNEHLNHRYLLDHKYTLLNDISRARSLNLRTATANDDLQTLYADFNQNLAALQHWYRITTEAQGFLDLSTMKLTLNNLVSDFEEAYRARKTELHSMNPRPESFYNGGWQKFWQSKYNEFENKGKKINPGLEDFKDFVFDKRTQEYSADEREDIARNAKDFWDNPVEGFDENPFNATPTEEDIKFFGLKLPPADLFSRFDQSRVFKKMTDNDFQDVLGYYENRKDEEDNRDWREWWENSGEQSDMIVWDKSGVFSPNVSLNS